MQFDLFDPPKKPEPIKIARAISAGPKKEVIDWADLNHDPDRYPYYSITYGYLVEHRSRTFEMRISLDSIQLINSPL